ncbi:MAG: acyl-CoA synthetase [Cyclobacteriaceae bacterium]
MPTLINLASEFANRTAIVSCGEKYSYKQLLVESGNFAGVLLHGSNDLNEQRIAFVVEPGFDYVKVQWAIWRAGGIAVPLHPKAPVASQEYVLKDAQVTQLVVSPAFQKEYIEPAKELDFRLVSTEEVSSGSGPLPNIALDRRAMILYTSGTTGAPKGVVTTHANIEAQITTLTKAWEWTSDDHIVNVLPMHHVHGIINVLSCALWSGATCEFSKFDAVDILSRLAHGPANLFMAVPTIYFKLITAYVAMNKEQQIEVSQGLKKMRLMVSGSAALPVSVLEKWREVSGHTLLERYGMTEMGMAISNPYLGERRPGHIGQPLEGVEVKLVDEQYQEIADDEQGEILVKGQNVFHEYWNKPEATTSAFTEDGWFKTGDVAIYDSDSYKIIGRSSIDIIKSGGYKLSALEIEEVLRSHNAVKDCAVVGLPDEEWGEIVATGLVSTESTLDAQELKQWLCDRLPAYKVPRIYHVMEDLPRNAMGKVVKNELKKLLTKS